MITRRSLLTGMGTGAAALGLTALGAAPAMAASKTVANFSHFPQANGYYCGPATVRMAAKIRNNWVTQNTAASFMGTTSSAGTNIRQVTDGLNQYVPGAVYTCEYYWRDSGYMSPTEINNMFDRIVKNVNDGYGTALNWFVPAGEYPGNPRLGNVYHHVLAIGYDTSERLVQIADPASSVFADVKPTYWVPLWKIVPWVGKRGYAW